MAESELVASFQDENRELKSELAALRERVAEYEKELLSYREAARRGVDVWVSRDFALRTQFDSEFRCGIHDEHPQQGVSGCFFDSSSFDPTAQSPETILALAGQEIEPGTCVPMRLLLCPLPKSEEGK